MSADRLPPPGFEAKIVARAALAAAVARLPRPVVLTNGVFDLLHRGHVTYLAQARALGASLVVAVNTDASVRRLGKGEDRPVNPQEDRAAVLAALESVSLVTLFDEDAPLPVVQIVRPEVYVKGGDYDMERVPEARLAREAEIAYATLALVTDYDCWRERTEAVTASMAMANLMENAANAQALVAAVIERLHGQRPVSAAHEALSSALVTPVAAMDNRVRQRLEPLLRRLV